MGPDDKTPDTSAHPGRALLLSGAAVLAFKIGCALCADALLDWASPQTCRGAFAHEAGDSSSYLSPIDNLRNEGTYYWHNGHERVLAGRMPHYGLLYLGSIAVFGPSLAKDGLVGLQVIADAAATVGLVILASRLSPGPLAGVVVVFLGGASMHASRHALYLSPESFAISSMALLLLSFDLAYERHLLRYVAVSGVLAGALVVLKPYMLPFCLPLTVALAWRWRNLPERGSASTRVGHAVTTFLLPLFVLLMPWTVRNYLVLHRFIPLQESITAGYSYNPAFHAYRRYLGSWGGSATWWDKRSAGCYFEPRAGHPCDFSLPAEALSASVDSGRVERARSLLQASNEDSRWSPAATTAFEQLAAAYRAERPFSYAIGAPLRLARGMLIHSGAYFLPVEAAPTPYLTALRAVKVVQSILYYVLLAAGTAGCALLVRRRPWAWTLAGVPLYLMVLFAWILRLGEFRYLDLSWPSMVVGGSALITESLKGVRARTGRR